MFQARSALLVADRLADWRYHGGYIMDYRTDIAYIHCLDYSYHCTLARQVVCTKTDWPIFSMVLAAVLPVSVHWPS